MVIGWRGVSMADSEKITINLSVVDLGKVDLLVDEGFYANRTDFIRTAIRNQLGRHDDEVKQRISYRAMLIGALIYGREDLEQVRAAGERLRISAVGMLVISDDVPAELAAATIESIKVFGVFRASNAVKEALGDRIR
jgi:Arc/MetJ-type ribon-helix-helix transcriptional regulator